MKHVIFDMDGVIFDTELLMIQCWEAVASREGMADVRNCCLQCVGRNSADTQAIFRQRYGSDFPVDRLRAEVVADFRNRIDHYGPPLKAHARELILFLKSRGYILGLASSTDNAIVRRELAQADLLHCFDQVVGGDQVEHSKPNPDIFLRACSLLKCRPQDAYVIEDSSNGIKAAYLAGTKPILVPDIIPPTPEMISMSLHCFETLEEVKVFFGNEGSS